MLSIIEAIARGIAMRVAIFGFLIALFSVSTEVMAACNMMEMKGNWTITLIARINNPSGSPGTYFDICAGVLTVKNTNQASLKITCSGDVETLTFTQSNVFLCDLRIGTNIKGRIQSIDSNMFIAHSTGSAGKKTFIGVKDF